MTMWKQKPDFHWLGKMEAKGDLAVCSGHIFLEMLVDTRRKVTSFAMEKEGCCGISFVSVSAPKMRPSKGQSESLSRREPEDVRCWLLLQLLFSRQSRFWMLISTTILSRGWETNIWPAVLCALLRPCFCVVVVCLSGVCCCCFYQKMKIRPGIYNDQRTWKWPLSHLLKVGFGSGVWWRDSCVRRSIM